MIFKQETVNGFKPFDIWLKRCIYCTASQRSVAHEDPKKGRDSAKGGENETFAQKSSSRKRKANLLESDDESGRLKFKPSIVSMSRSTISYSDCQHRYPCIHRNRCTMKPKNACSKRQFFESRPSQRDGKQYQNFHISSFVQIGNTLPSLPTFQVERRVATQLVVLILCVARSAEPQPNSQDATTCVQHSPKSHM